MAVQNPSIPVAAPSRTRFAVLALLFGAIGALLIDYVVSEQVGISMMALIASITMAMTSLVAIWVFRRLQLPLEAAQAVTEDQAYRLQVLEQEVAVNRAALRARQGESLTPQRALEETTQLREDLQQAQEVAELQRRSSEAMLAASDDRLVLVGLDGQIIAATRNAAALLDLMPAETVGRPFGTVFALFDVTQDEPLQHPLNARVLAALDEQAPPVPAFEALLERRTRFSIKVRVECLPIRDRRSRAARLLVALHLTDGGAAVGGPEALEGGSTGDPLTGAAGAQRFERRIEELLQEARRSGNFHGVMLIAPDDFEAVYDRLGYAAGEERLWQVASLIRSHLPPGAEFYRPSAKHFAALIPEQPDSACRALAQQMCADVAARPFYRDNLTVSSSLSIGVVSIGLANTSCQDIIDRATHALKRARELGGGRVHVESLVQSMEEQAREQSLGEWLENKLLTNKLRLAAQPIVPAAANAGAPPWLELLLRIEDDDGVWLPPDHYIDVLEKLGLTPLVDRWVVDQALKPSPRATQIKNSGGRLSINIFGSSLLRDSFLQEMRELLVRSAVPTTQLCFEIEESFIVQHQQHAAAFVSMVGEFGCQIAIDRYRGGVGLTALRHVPATYIKLHESLVTRQNFDVIDRAHLDWLTSAAKLVDAKVVACAVRDDEMLERLRAAKVDFVQGFAIASPSPYSI